MTEARYQKMLAIWRKSSRREKIGQTAVKLLPPIFFCVYGAELLLLLIKDGFSRNLLGALVAPAVALGVSNLLRRLIDRPRPYTVYSIRPLIFKSTQGRSFPSNHTTSAFVLAITAFRLSAGVGVVMLILAILTGLSRLSAGLHWPTDVLFGAGLGILLGAAGLIII